MEIESLEIELYDTLSFLPHDNLTEITIATQLKSTTTYINGENPYSPYVIAVTEYLINSDTSPDIALIKAETPTPIQKNNSESTLYQIPMYCSSLMGYIIYNEAENKIKYGYYDMDKHGGIRAIKVEPGEIIQMIIDEGQTFIFYDLWTPKGYMADRGILESSYGSRTLIKKDLNQLPEDFKTYQNMIKVEVKNHLLQKTNHE